MAKTLWTLDKNPGRSQARIGYDWDILDGQGNFVASLFLDDGEDVTAEDTANLLVSAPRLLEERNALLAALKSIACFDVAFDAPAPFSGDEAREIAKRAVASVE